MTLLFYILFLLLPLNSVGKDKAPFYPTRPHTYLVKPFKAKQRHHIAVKYFNRKSIYTSPHNTNRTLEVNPPVPQDPPTHRSVIIGGIAKNIESSLPNLIQNLENIKNAFDSAITFLVIDENSDNTEALLENYAANTDNTYLYKIKNHGHRTEKIANARNKVLEVSTPYLDTYDFFLVFDLDFREISTSSIENTLKDEKSWDVVTANTPSYYYDRWALRTKDYNDSCWKDWKNRNCDVPLSGWFPDSSLKQKIPSDSAPLEVISAFGGLAIYKNKLLKNCRENEDCKYSGNCERGEKCSFDQDMDCEHVHFHKHLTKHTGAKVMIWPSLTIWR